MAYKHTYYEKAVALIKENAKKREKQFENSLNEAYILFPELKDTNEKLSALGAKAIKAALYSKTQELKEIEEETKILTAKKKELEKAAKVKGPKPICSKCNDTGYIGASLCECAKALAKDLVFKDLSETVPINQTFQTFDLSFYEGKDRKIMESIYNFSLNYADNFTRKSDNLLFLGGVGLGKTHLSLSIINRVIDKGYGVVYATAQNLLNEIEKEHFSYSGSSEKIDAVLSCDLLVIDDLGTEFSTSFTVSQLYNIINTRIISSLPTIINTNLSFQEIEKNYTPRVLSRIMGSYKVKQFTGPDIRIKKALKK